MKARDVLAAMVLTALIILPAAGQDAAPAKPDESAAATQPAAIPLPRPPEVMKEAVDPFNPPKERNRLFTAGGPDSELSHNEFAAARAKKNSFVRKFDTFEEMRKFDRDRNGTTDWFEANAYREDIRKRVLADFDPDKNGKLTCPAKSAAPGSPSRDT